MQVSNNDSGNSGGKKNKKEKKKKKKKKGNTALMTYTSDRIETVRRNLGGWGTAAAVAGAASIGGVAWYFGRDAIGNNYLRGLALLSLGAPLLLIKNRTVASAGAALGVVGLVTSSLTFFKNNWPAEEDGGSNEA